MHRQASTMLLRCTARQARFSGLSTSAKKDLYGGTVATKDKAAAFAGKQKTDLSRDYMLLNGLFAALALGGATLLYNSTLFDDSGEQKLREQIAKRDGKEGRVDLYKLRADLAALVRCIEPNRASALVHVATQLALYGGPEGLEDKEGFEALREFKENHRAFSWADLGAYVAHHGLVEMGGPLVGFEPLVGRLDRAVQAKAPQPFPGSNATYEELRRFGDQFNLTDGELVAVAGGAGDASVLFSPTKTSLLDVSAYRRFTEGYEAGRDVSALPLGPLLGHNQVTRECAALFAYDKTYWNLHFSRAWAKIFNAPWEGQIRPLPARFERAATMTGFALRQSEAYGQAMDSKVAKVVQK